MEMTDLNQIKIDDEYAKPAVLIRAPNVMNMDSCQEPEDGEMSWCMDDKNLTWVAGLRCW